MGLFARQLDFEQGAVFDGQHRRRVLIVGAVEGKLLQVGNRLVHRLNQVDQFVARAVQLKCTLVDGQSLNVANRLGIKPRM